ncbi:MAG: serine protease DegQ [Cryptosporangiaceae bacterium]|nr:serine protease DegQ [Cryptosporangiaceae bacterium]
MTRAGGVTGARRAVAGGAEVSFALVRRVAVLAWAAVMLGGCTGTFGRGGPATESPVPSPAASSPIPGGAGAAGGPDAAAPWVAIADAAAPSLVTVSAGPVTGSGVVYAAAGTILTAAHVVGAFKRVELRFADGSRGPGTVSAVDPLADLAVVQSERKALPPATFATEVPPPGSPVLLAGGPGAGLTETILGGIAPPRPAAATVGRAVTDVLFSGSAIAVANSGGAVLDADGHVAGIAEAPVAGQSELGAILPGPAVTVAVGRMLGRAAIRHAVLGLRPTAPTLPMAEAYHLDSSGVLVQDVTAGGPAAKAGVRAGDVLVTLGGERLSTISAYLRVVAGIAPSQAVSLTLLRGGVSHDLTIAPGVLGR